MAPLIWLLHYYTHGCLYLDKEVNMEKDRVRHVFISIIISFFVSKSCKGKDLKKLMTNV